jgi:hypothetical protein
MAQIDDVVDALATLLHYPEWDTLTMVQRLYHVTRAVQDLMDELQYTRVPSLVKRVELELDGEDGVPVPADYGSAYHIVTDPSYYTGEAPIQLSMTYAPDADFDSIDFADGRVSRVEERTENGVTRLYGWPHGASTTQVLLYYRPGAVGDLSLGDDVPLAERFHLNVVPVLAAMYALPYCTWEGLDGASNKARRDELAAALGPQSAAAVAKFKNLIHHPGGTGGPRATIGGFGAGRNRARFGRG